MTLSPPLTFHPAQPATRPADRTGVPTSSGDRRSIAPPRKAPRVRRWFVEGEGSLSKSKKHFIGLTWDDGNGNKGGAAFQADKNEYRGVLAGLEGVTGKRAVNSEAITVKN
jgi:hypothetical protein